MKKCYMALLIVASLGLSVSTYANLAAAPKTQNKVLAANCASNCESCWDQCTSADNCGVGFNCSTSPCGNRCTKK